MDSKEIAAVKSFIAAINQRDASQLSKLMTSDHTFVDASGRAHTGRDKMTQGWNDYYRMFPDYTIEAEFILQDGDLVAAFGSAAGTYNGKRGLVPENRIEMPAAWKAIVKDGKIKLWQVYADWTEGWKTIEEDQKS
jgi:ketosteroid isomerase-like protein